MMRSCSWRALRAVGLALGLASGTSLSCGGSGGDGGKSPAFTVSSPDGVLTLQLPEGALPAGVTQGSVSIGELASAELPLVDGVAVRRGWTLSPDGLVLVVPAVAILTLDATDPGGAPLSVLHQSGPGVTPLLEFLPTELDPMTSPDTAKLRMSIAHFSRLVVSNVGATFSSSLSSPPSTVFVGEYFAFENKLIPLIPHSITYTPNETLVIGGSPTTVSWGDGSLWTVKSEIRPAGLDPSMTIDEVVTDQVAPPEVSFRHVFKCPAEGRYSLSADLTASVETELGAVVNATTTSWYRPGRSGTCVEPGGDPIGDLVDSVSASAVQAARQAVDIVKRGARREALTAAQVAATYNNSVYPCSLDDADVKVVCPANLQPMPAGDVLTFFLRVNAAIPRADAATSYIYSVVLDSDGVGANDWRFVAPFDWDYFQGTDRWYQLSWNHMTRAWSLTATQVDASQQTAVVPTTARAVLAGDSIVFHISASELAAATGYRLSAFGHDGRFTQATRGGDVTGANPTEALLPMPQ